MKIHNGLLIIAAIVCSISGTGLRKDCERMHGGMACRQGGHAGARRYGKSLR